MIIVRARINAISIPASIMAGGSHMQASFNSIKLESPAYYCNSYTPPGPVPVDHHGMPLSSGYSEYSSRRSNAWACVNSN